MRTKLEEVKYINSIQNQYVDELIALIEAEENNIFKEANLTSPTGTGKTEMIAKLINRKPEWFFLVTTISHGQLHKQVQAKLAEKCRNGNYQVYGVSSFTKASLLREEDILACLPPERKIIWLRDEGHRNTNNWSVLLDERVDKIVNISATNKTDGGIVCNFSDTMMLRTVQQQQGSIHDAIAKFLEVKKAHARVKKYTPCILFRVLSSKTGEEIEQICKAKNIKFKSLVGYDDYDMSELCQDNCPVQAIIYQQKMDVGIDIRRAHVIWIEANPKNISTTIQCVGRCRRNALFWRDDIDIMLPENEALLNATRICYAFYRLSQTEVDTNEYGELVNAFCPYISVQKLREGSTVSVQDGMLQNGLTVIELVGCTGEYRVRKDSQTGLNTVTNPAFYKKQTQKVANHLLDPRQDAMFIVPAKVRKLIGEAVDVLENPTCPNVQYHLRTKYVDGCVEIAYAMNKLQFHIYCHNGKWEMSRRWAQYRQFDNEQEFTRSVLNCCESAPLEPIIALARLCTKSKKFPVRISEEKYYNALVKWQDKGLGPSTIELYNSSSSLQGETALTYRADCYCEYTLAECKQIALHGTIAPNREQYYQMETNNRELAIVGAELFQHSGNSWTPCRSVTALLGANTKLNKLLYQRFDRIINIARPYFYNSKNKFEFNDKRQNSCLGQCVEYYAKALLYKDYITSELRGISSDYPEDVRIFRACLEKYKKMMLATFGVGLARYLRVPSADALGQEGWSAFKQTCISLGQQTRSRLCGFFSCSDTIEMEYDPVLSTNHLCGLMDVVSNDTIIDIKVTSSIAEKMLLQVLAYFYLSQYRSDLTIDRLIIYDAAMDRYLIIKGVASGQITIMANYEPLTKRLP